MPNSERARVPANRERQTSLHGYDELALRAAMAGAGYKYPGPAIARMTGLNITTVRHRIQDGKWTRNNISRIVAALNLSPEQTMNIFFTGHGEAVDQAKRYDYSFPNRPAKDESLAHQLDNMLRGIEDE